MRSTIPRWQLGRLLAAVLALAVCVVSCSDDEDTSPTAPSRGAVIFHFDQEVDGAPLVIESSQSSFPYANAAANPYNVDRLEYYVSNFRVHRTDGTVYGTEDFLFRDADNDGTRSYLLSAVPNGLYDAVSFTFGLDAKTNVTGGLPTLELMWPENWGGGYHYMMMNGRYSNGSTDVPYRIHTGRRFIQQMGDPSGEGPDSVAYHHFFEVYLPVTPFEVNGDIWSVRSIMDVNGWYMDPVFDLATFFPTGSEGIMVDLTAQALLMENGMQNVYRVVDPVKN